ncbi:hypothetical protein AZA_89905 [Nitrospirillum viridazoti Y2]|nr:hypothetical protein AZA_89905 [Nitrospirillum amazonense Y2]
MAFHRQRQLVGRHAAAVVHHLDQGLAAVTQGDVDAAGAGVQRVLHQLFHGGGGTFHHLAGGDAVDQGLRQKANGHGGGIVAGRRASGQCARSLDPSLNRRAPASAGWASSFFSLLTLPEKVRRPRSRPRNSTAGGAQSSAT